MCCAISQILLSQPSSYKRIPFSQPIHLPFDLAGCFGEPRTAHFHSGIDIKTDGTEGKPVFSIYDGYISRIKVSPYGYGKCIYIKHPNGLTSVYAHLSAFNRKIEKYIHEQHYKNNQSELDVFFDSTIMPIRQDDTIAFSGNTGGSGGPHLHFEIRDSKSEHSINPLLFNYSYIDTIPPSISSIKIYEIYDNYYNAASESIQLIKKDNTLTVSQPVEVSSNAKAIGIGVQGYDQQFNNENKNGIYRIIVKKGSINIFQYTLNEIDFDKTRMVSAFMDYKEQQQNKKDEYQCFRLPNNTLSIYDTIVNNGFLETPDTIEYITIECYDFKLNKTTILIPISAASKKTKSTVKSSLNFRKKNTLRDKGFSITFYENTFYDDVSLNFKMDSSYTPPVYTMEENQYIPLNKACTVELESKILGTELKKNAVIVVKNHEDKETALTTNVKDKWAYANTKDIGTFYLSFDTIKPFIQLLNYTAEGSKFTSNTIRVKISDNLSGISEYNGFIDGHWVNFYYDAKNDMLEYKFDEYCPSGEHKLILLVTDKKQNQATLEQYFKN